jgi:chorismate mutase
MTTALDALREEIDSLDEQLVALVALRVGLATAVASEKARLGVPLLDPAREGEVVERAVARAVHAGLDAEEVRALMRRLLALSRRAQLGVYEAARPGADRRPGERDAGDSHRSHP